MNKYPFATLVVLALANAGYPVAGEEIPPGGRLMVSDKTRHAQQDYEKLRLLSGSEYARARELFLPVYCSHCGNLRTDDAARAQVKTAKEFLESKVKKSPDDPFARALLLRACNDDQVRAFEYVATNLKRFDAYKSTVLDAEVFDWSKLYNALRFQPARDPVDGAIPKEVAHFDYMAEYALRIEWLVHNPEGLSAAFRFWGLLEWRKQPTTIDELKSPSWKSYFDSKNPYVSEAIKTLQPEQLDRWINFACQYAPDDVGKLVLAARARGPKAAGVLQDLSKHDGYVGALAVLLLAGCYPLGSSIAHPFDGVLLENWALQANPSQLNAIEGIFARDHDGERSDLEKNGTKLIYRTGKPDFASLGISRFAAGVFLKHHAQRFHPRMVEVYSHGQEASLEEFICSLQGYFAIDDLELNRFANAERCLREARLWPAGAENRLLEIKTADPKARALIEKAEAALRTRIKGYPSGAEVQGIFSPAPALSTEQK